MPEVEGEEVPGVLSANHGWESEWEHVVVQEAVHDWAHHVGEDVLTDEVNGVLDDHNSEVDKLMHNEGRDRVIVVEVGLTKVDVGTVHDWVKVTVLIQNKISFKV